MDFLCAGNIGKSLDNLEQPPARERIRSRVMV